MAAPVTAESSASSDILTTAFDTLQDSLGLILPDNLQEKGIRIRLGAGFGSLPDYVGSDNYRRKTLPIIDIRYGKRWRVNFNKLSYSMLVRDRWELGPFIKYKSGRSETRNPILAGLGKIKPTAQLGIFARYKNEQMMARIEFRQALSEMQDRSVRVTVGHGLFKEKKLSLAAILRGKWMSKEAMQTNFGITTEQASSSVAGLNTFEAGAGVSELSANLLTRYDLTDKYRLLALISYDRLIGDAAKSPLVTGDAGDRNQFKLGVGFTIDF